MKFFVFLCYIIVVSCCVSCGEDKGTSSSKSINEATDTSTDKHAFIPVTEFIKGQIKEFNSIEVAPLHIKTKNGKADSTWLKREEMASFATPFLTPVIDSASMAKYFSEKSFMDQTVNAFTFTYEPKSDLPGDINLAKWDVYIDPNSSVIRRVFIVKKTINNDVTKTEQLTWIKSSWFKITTITEQEGQKPIIEEEQVIYNFD